MIRDPRITIRIDVDGRSAIDGIGGVQRSAAGLGQSFEAAANRADASFAQTRRGLESISAQLSRLQSAANVLIGLTVGSQVLTSYARLADSYTNIQSKLRLVTDGEAALNRVRDATFEIAQRTRQSNEATVELYARMTRATEQLGLSEQQRLRIVETVNKALVVSGATSTEAAAALIQLSQGLSSGALRGEEFNSIAEQAPIILDLLSESLGRSRGELRAMAEQGQLTAAVLTTALLAGSREIDAQFGQMSNTIAGASTQLANAWSQWVGQASEGVGASNAIASSISALAENLDTAINAVGALGVAWGTGYVVNIAAAIAADIRKTASGIALTRAELANQAQLAAARTAEVAQTLQVVAAARAEEVVKLRKAQAEVAAAQATVSATAAMGAQSAAIRANTLATEQLTAAKARLAAATTALATLGAQEARLQAAAAAATTAQIGAQTALAGATTATAAAMARLRSAGAAVVGLLGGPWGAAIVGGTAAVIALNAALEDSAEWERRVSDESRERARAQEAATAAYTAAWQEYRRNNPEQIAKDLRANNVALERAAARARDGGASAQLYAQRVEILAARQRELTAELRAANPELAKQQRVLTTGQAAIDEVIKASSERIAQLRRQIAEAQGGARGALLADLAELQRQGIATPKMMTPAQRAALQENARLLAELDARLKATTSSTRAASKAAGDHAKLEDQRSDALQRLTDLAAEWSGELTGGLSRAIQQHSARLQQLDQIEKRLNATQRVSADEARKLADARSLAEQALRRAIDERVAALRGPLAQAEFEHAERMRENETLREQLIAQGMQVAEVEALIATATANANREREKTARRIWEQQNPYDALLESLEREIQLLGRSGREREIAAIALELENAARDQGITKTKAQIDAEARLLEQRLRGARLDGREKELRRSGEALFGLVRREDLDEVFPFRSFADLLAGSAVEGLRRGGQGFLRTFSDGLREAFEKSPLQAGASIFEFLAGIQQERRAGRDTVGSFLTAATNAAANSGIPQAQAVAAAVHAINSLFNGRLLGTTWERSGTGLRLGIGAGGVTGSTSETQVRQRSLFRGRQWRTTETALDDSTRGQLEAWLDAMREAVAAGARALRVEAPALIEGSFREVRDAQGRITSQISTVLGRTWSESVEQFKQRLTAENLLAVIDRAVDVSAIAERWRGNASELLDGAQFLLAAVSDIQRGVGLLGDASTLPALADLIEDLQQPSETLAEAYTRVSGATALLDRALRLSGVTLDDTREAVIRFAVGIADAAGGLEQASRLWERYFEVAFTPLERLQAALAEAESVRDQVLAQAGLGADATVAQIRAAIETALAAGSDPEQVVRLLQAADAVATVNELLAQLADLASESARALEAEAEARRQALATYAELASELIREVAAIGASDLVRELGEVRRAERERIAALNDAARAAGMQAAREEDLARAHLLAADAAARAIARARAAAQSIVDDLYGTPLQQIEAQIAAIQGAGGTGGLSAIAAGADQVAGAWQSAIDRIRGWLDDLMTGPLGGLRPRDALAEAQRQFQSTLAAARGGDAEAAGRLPQLAEQVLRLGQRVFASGDPYFSLRDEIRGALQSVVGLSGPGGGSVGGGAVGSVGGGASDNSALAELLRQRDELLAAQEAQRRRAQAEELAAYVREIAQVTGELPLAILAGMGVPLDRFAADLGIRLDELTVETTGALAALANRLAIELPDLASALGVELGALADANSLLNDALEAVIARQPPEIAAALAPLLARLEEALTPEEQEAALAALEEYIGQLAPALRLAFAPFFDGIDPETVDEQIATLAGIRDISAEQLGALVEVREAVLRGIDVAEMIGVDTMVEQRRTTSAVDRAAEAQTGALREVRDAVDGGLGEVVRAIREAMQPVQPPAPEASFAVGTPRVPRDMFAQIHRGEAVIDARSMQVLRDYGIRVVAAPSQSDAVVAELRQLREERSAADGLSRTLADRIERLERAQRETAAAIERQTAVQRRSLA